MVNYKKVSCPNCGALIEDIDRFAAMAVCEYCGGAMVWQDDAVLAMGDMAILVEYPTPLYLHATGQVRGKRFEVAGRVRYRYAKGFWDEWYLAFEDGSYGWIAEDEYEFSFERAVRGPVQIPAYSQVSPGGQLVVEGKFVIVDEKDVAYLEGAEGSLPWVLTKDRQFPYVEASQGDYMVTIEYTEGAPEVFVGEWVDVGEIKLDYPKDDQEDGSGWSDA